jgi:hypothetical protein
LESQGDTPEILRLSGKGDPFELEAAEPPRDRRLLAACRPLRSAKHRLRYGTFRETRTEKNCRKGAKFSSQGGVRWAYPQCQARASTLLTDLAYQAPPRGVVMPLAFSASAIWCSDVAPVRCISRITGSTLTACWSARALMDTTACWRAYAKRQCHSIKRNAELVIIPPNHAACSA